MVCTGPTLFSRLSRRGEHLRKVNVTASHEWRTDCCLADPQRAPVIADLVGHSTSGGDSAYYVGRHGKSKVAKMVFTAAVSR